MLENTLLQGEEKNDLELAQQMAKLGTFTSTMPSAPRTRTRQHRGRGSLLAAVSGFLMEQELNTWAVQRRIRATLRRHFGRREDQRQDHGRREPARQVRQAHHRRRHGEHLLAAKGYDMADSLVETGSIETAKNTRRRGDKLVLPVDAVVATNSMPKPTARS